MTVPISPGVPALPAGVGVSQPPVTPLTSDGPSALAESNPIIWGIYDTDNNPVITGDSVKAFDFRNEYRVSDFPVENGSFASYNKVATPFDVLVTFVQSGSIEAKQDFLKQLSSSLSALTLYSVWTPELQFESVNLVRISYRRSAREGAQMLTVDVYCREIREAGSIEFSNTATPDGAAQRNDGTIQAQSVTQTSTPATDTSPGSINGPLPPNAVINPDNGQFLVNPDSTQTINMYGPLPIDGDPNKLPPGTPVM